MTLGSRLKKLRLDAGLSHAELSKATNGAVSGGNISRYENDIIFPTVPTIIALCNYFNITSDWLLFGMESQKKAEVISDPDLQYAYEILKELYQSPNPNLRGWAIITFENAFADYIEEPLQQVQKRKKDA